MKEKSTIFYGVLLLLECLLWGIGNPIMKIGLELVPPLYCLSIRYILAFVLFMLVFGKQVFAKVNKAHLVPYLVISACTAASFISSAFSLIYTTATNSGFLMSTAVVFTPFLSYFILKSKIDKKHVLPIVIVNVGLYLLCNGDGGFSLGIGEIFGLLCAIAGACMLVFSSKYIRDMDPITMSTIQSGFTGLFCLIFALVFEDFPGFAGISLVGWYVIIYLAVGCTCVAYLLQNIALNHLPATYVALTFCSEPIFTAIASYFLLGEILSAKGFIGAALIMLSIIIASLLPDELLEETQL